ncbi:DUF2785 domain-containing protein [Heyndrickxia oleronia]|uniref:DUF2785 domain-containing protein n=1 Tax=Heyndrickxia oleronia TaxID=38875 RepID=UPI0037524CB0
MLKEQLYEIIRHNYALPKGLDEFEAVQQVIGVLGSTDAEVRDELGYRILANWLLRKNFLTGSQLSILLEQAISDDMLFFKIGEAESDHVFKRTFSALLIALILIRDNREEFLGEAAFFQALERINLYCRLEKDYRSYVEGKGWAHGPAHISDAIDECVRHRFTGLDECSKLWEGLLHLIDGAPHVYDAEEDERITIPIIAMVESGKVPFSTLCRWLERIELPAEKDLISMTRRINIKHFIRCLIFGLLGKGLGKVEDLIIIERKFNPFVAS